MTILWWFLFCTYLFIFNIDVHFLGADGLADVVDVIFSAVIKYVFVLFPESERNRLSVKWNNQILCLPKWYKKTSVMQESLFIKDIIDKANAYFFRVTLKRWWHVPSPLGTVAQDTHTQPHPLTSDCIWFKSPPGTRNKSECLGEEGCRSDGSSGGGVGQLGEGEKRGKISFRALRLPIPLTHSD